MAAPASAGCPRSEILVVASRLSVEEAVRRLLERLEQRVVRVFAVIDHAAAAREAGLEMPATKVVVFGSPEAGTPLMLEAPSLALDLPLRLLIAAAPEGGCRLTYADPEALALRHRLPAGMAAPLGAVAALARGLSEG